MSQEASLEVAMQLIMYGGEAKSCAIEAMAAAKKRDFQVATERMVAARAALLEAHNLQTKFLAQEASGTKTEITALFVHSQDHLMTSMTEINLIKEIISLRKELHKK